MKKLLVLLFMFALVATAQEAPPECELEPMIYCDATACILIYQCRTSGSCPGECWCPGRTCGGTFTSNVTQVQKQGVEILVAKQYVKKQVHLTPTEVYNLTPRVLSAHGATWPPPDCDPCPPPAQSSCCQACYTWDIVCWLICQWCDKPQKILRDDTVLVAWGKPYEYEIPGACQVGGGN